MGHHLSHDDDDLMGDTGSSLEATSGSTARLAPPPSTTNRTESASSPALQLSQHAGSLRLLNAKTPPAHPPTNIVNIYTNDGEPWTCQNFLACYP